MLLTTRFDIQEHLKTPQDRDDYLDVALADGNPALLECALQDIVGSVELARLERGAKAS